LAFAFLVAARGFTEGAVAVCVDAGAGVVVVVVFEAVSFDVVLDCGSGPVLSSLLQA
jgi:hypothetical protein